MNWAGPCGQISVAAGAALLLLAFASSAEAGALGRALRASIAKRATATAPAQIAGKPRDVIIHRSRHPEAAAHIERAQRQGQPTVLHIDRAGAARRRSEATGSVDRQRKPAPKTDRDEYPPAVTREGGGNSSVYWISRRDNRGAGGSIFQQTRDLPDGSKIRIIVTD